MLQHHLNIWQSFNDGHDPFGGMFRGRIDLHKVGTMGHSRGGEGVVRHVRWNASLGSPYKIKAVLPLAPVNFKRGTINNIPLGVLLPYCDGDVTSFTALQFRAGLDFANSLNAPTAQDLNVLLVDAMGRQASARVSEYSRALFFPPGSGATRPTPKVILNTIRIPLAAFVNVDKSIIRTVRFVLNQRDSGALLVSDIAFTR